MPEITNSNTGLGNTVSQFVTAVKDYVILNSDCKFHLICKKLREYKKANDLPPVYALKTLGIVAGVCLS